MQFFSKQPLIWATASLAVLWAASQLALLQLLQPNAVAVRGATSSCKPAGQERRNKSTKVRSTVRTRPHKSGADPNTPVFCHSFANSSSRYRLEHIAPTWSSKSAPEAWIELSLKSAARFLSTTLPDRRTEPQKQRPEKNTRCRAQKCFHAWIHTLPNCPNSRLLDEGWLTWWCGWQDGVNAKHDHRP